MKCFKGRAFSRKALPVLSYLTRGSCHSARMALLLVKPPFSENSITAGGLQSFRTDKTTSQGARGMPKTNACAFSRKKCQGGWKEKRGTKRKQNREKEKKKNNNKSNVNLETWVSRITVKNRRCYYHQGDHDWWLALWQTFTTWQRTELRRLTSETPSDRLKDSSTVPIYYWWTFIYQLALHLNSVPSQLYKRRDCIMAICSKTITLS